MKTLLKIAFLVFAIYLNYTAVAQTSIHQEQSNFYKQFDFTTESEFDSLRGATTGSLAGKNERGGACQLEKQVYGWHPYWMGSAYNNYDFSLLSTVSYFSYEVDPTTGNYSTIRDWKNTNLVNLAQAAGCRVELCVTNFGSSNNSTFLSNPVARQTLIDSLIALVQLRNADGVNIDFEGVPGSQRTNLTNFMISLCNQMHTAIPGSSVSIALYAVDWNDIFDIATLDQYVDQFIIMGYAYYWSGSSTAGPTAPLYSGSIWWSYNLTRTVNYYVNEGITRSKLLLGLPYYGREWETAAGTVPSSNTNSVGARTYNWIRNNYEGTYQHTWDPQSFTYYYAYQNSGQWRQCFYDGKRSLGHRYDMVLDWGLGGIGIWALGYDDGYSDLWNLIEEKFTDCAVQACVDTFYDMGGPFGQYRDFEDWTKTIAPDGAANVAVTFNSFDVEANYDFVSFYDGSSTSDSLIGSYSGTINPGTIVSSGPALTMRFTSDIGVREDGWDATWQCDVYCPSLATNATDEWIQSICVNTICSNSGNNNGYGDYTHTNPKLKTGKTYNLTLTPGFGGSPQPQFWKIWIDLNANYSFDDVGELIYESMTASSNPVNSSFMIPYAGYEGTTILRIQMKRAALPGSCEIFEFGEVEDYKIRVEFGCAVPDGLSALNISTTSATLSWNGTGADTYLMKIRKVGSGPWFEFHATVDSLPLQILQPGTTYDVKVKSLCFTENQVSGFGPTVTFTTLSGTKLSSNTQTQEPQFQARGGQLLVRGILENVTPIRLINLQGQMIWQAEIQPGFSEQFVNLGSEIPVGIYLLATDHYSQKILINQ